MPSLSCCELNRTHEALAWDDGCNRDTDELLDCAAHNWGAHDPHCTLTFSSHSSDDCIFKRLNGVLSDANFVTIDIGDSLDDSFENWTSSYHPDKFSLFRGIECPNCLANCPNGGEVWRTLPMENFVQGALGNPAPFSQVFDADSEIVPQDIIEGDDECLIGGHRCMEEPIDRAQLYHSVVTDG